MYSFSAHHFVCPHVSRTLQSEMHPGGFTWGILCPRPPHGPVAPPVQGHGSQACEKHVYSTNGKWAAL